MPKTEVNVKKLLFITTRLCSPVNSGRRYSLYHCMRGLSLVYGYEIYQYSFFEKGQTISDINNQPDFVNMIFPAKKVHLLDKAKNVIRDIFRKNKLPLQCLLYYSKSNVKEIAKIVERIKCDVIIVDMVRLAPYIEAFSGFPALKIIDLNDLLSKRYKRQLESSYSNADISGNYGNETTSVFKKIINLSFLKKIILKSEIKRLEKYERKCYSIYDKTIFVSDKETSYLNNLMSDNKAHTVTLGIDYDYYSENIEVMKKENYISFLGNLNVAANIDSLEMIVKDILPEIQTSVTLKVIGESSNQIRSKYKMYTNIIFTGRVDDLRVEICETALFLSPIAYGSGIKTKILEAMAMGKAVVTNSVGAEGLAIENGKHLFVYDNFKDIAKCVDSLLKDEITLKTIGEQAKAVVKEKYQWELIWEEFKNIGITKFVELMETEVS